MYKSHDFARKGLIALYTVMVSLTTVPCLAFDQNQPYGDQAISGSIEINAEPRIVFEAIKNSRYLDPNRRKVISCKGNEVVLHEQFNTVPVLGKASCRYKEIESPPARIDYDLIESDHFRSFAGRWELTPVKNGRSTLLRLTSKVDTYIAVPFKKQITAASTRKDVNRRLNDIKRQVEQPGKSASGIARQVTLVPDAGL